MRRPWVGPVGVGGVHRWGREVSREKKDNGVSTSCYSHGDVGPDPEGTPGRLSGTKLRMSLQGGGGWASLHQSDSQGISSWFTLNMCPHSPEMFLSSQRIPEAMGAYWEVFAMTWGWLRRCGESRTMFNPLSSVVLGVVLEGLAEASYPQS